MKRLRMGLTGIAALVFLAVSIAIRPEQGFLLAWKFSLILTAGWLGYWLDRGLFPYARPHEASTQDQPLVMVRRAIIVGATMLATGLAV